MNYQQPPDATGTVVLGPAALAAATATTEFDVWGYEAVDLAVNVSTKGALTNVSVTWQWSPTYPGVDWYTVQGGELSGSTQTLGDFAESRALTAAVKLGMGLQRVYGRSMRAVLTPTPTADASNSVTATIMRR